MLDAEPLVLSRRRCFRERLAREHIMAVSKALCKSAALRRGRRINELLREANAEIARENPESLFITVFAGVLDVLSGRLDIATPVTNRLSFWLLMARLRDSRGWRAAVMRA